ncbi:heme-binding domain-containing protein [Flagellimonas pacifica]|uniref:Haem-binding domain-containing protein n=1 Tax=Flagellimonas pacifica TaxID=1247520 RepID=A0A285MVW0_9FLAO|nr:heme-binding domain-containing protein [Allomuricauda parva]SNZ01325.1 Haem-binding domain-containing protein [Allomuricauda parva]
MKVLKITIWAVLALLVGIQFIRPTGNHSDLVPKTDFMKVNEVPQNVKGILKTSCYDCHSNNTEYPWYNSIQPMAWILENHIEDGKEELNFNQWGEYSSRRKNSKLKSIINQVEDDAMPLSSYTLIHRDAKLSEAEKKTLLDWVSKLKDGL